MAYALGATLSLLSLLLAYFFLPAGEARWPILSLLSLFFSAMALAWAPRFEECLSNFLSLRDELKRQRHI